MTEARSNPRARCRIPCEIQSSSGRAGGTVLDASQGGLSVQTSIQAEEGEVLRVHLKVPGERESLEIESIVWNTRSVNEGGTSKRISVLGLMVLKAPDAYFNLVPR